MVGKQEGKDECGGVSCHFTSVWDGCTGGWGDSLACFRPRYSGADSEARPALVAF